MATEMIVFTFFMVLFPISALAQSNGSVAVGSNLTADGTSSPWLSPSGEFAFGFKPLQDTGRFLLCIWYQNIPDQTVAWYVNSIDPVPRGSTVRVDARRGLLLLDPRSQTLWSTDAINNQTETDHGVLNDTGNFVLQGSDGQLLWESFRLYADTILPSQELDIGGALNSRLSETNFSNGRFYLRFGADGNLVLTSKSVPGNLDEDAVYYNSQTSDPTNPLNSGTRVVFDSRGSIYVMRKNNQTNQLSPISVAPASENYYRATLEFDGVFILYAHPKRFTGNPKWNIVWSLPDNICINLTGEKGSGACGFNNICSLAEKRPVCNCPQGYSLVDPNDEYGSCKPNFTPTCDEAFQSSTANESGLVMLEEVDVDWPLSDYQQINPATETLCEQSCLHDCFCAVAIFRSNSCWKKKLPLSNGRVDTSLGSKAFIKSSSSYNPTGPNLPRGSKPKDRGTLILVGSVLLGTSLFVNFALLGTVCLGFYLIYRKRKPNIHSNAAAAETNLRHFTFKELTEATNGFKEELGSGSFGVVYKGQLAMSYSGNFSVAVKKLNILAREKEFRAEVNSIGQTNHKNLVRLLGFCDEGQNRLLVYECMSNGTLASFIFKDDKPSWNKRKQMAIGIARGLVYLHEECRIQIIHCDIKPQNILLDDYHNVRISDFGLAKLLDINQSQVSRTNVRGTKGYVAPEWFRNHQITVKVDVYSFGVLLLEIISCRKCIQEISTGEEEDWELPLTDLAWDCFKEKRLDTLVADDLEALNDRATLETFVMVGLWCIQESSSLRPTMRKVSQMLEGIMEVQIPPCPSPFSSVG